MWRAINGEMFLKEDGVKRVYLDRFFKFFGRARGAVMVYAFVAMSNHFHLAAELLKDCRPLSRWIRSAHSSFGLWLNKLLKRRGPVAQDRPKTVVVEDDQHLKRLMFYIDWNPVRAGMCNHPSEYQFSSYRFYAFGEVNAWTKHITPPKWYLALGSTPEERQRRYREECDRYDQEKRLPEKEEADRNHAMGSPRFVARRTLFLRQASLILAGSPRAFPQRAGVDASRREMTRSKLRELLDIEFSLAAGPGAGLGAGQMGACGGAAESQAPPMP